MPDFQRASEEEIADQHLRIEDAGVTPSSLERLTKCARFWNGETYMGSSVVSDLWFWEEVLAERVVRWITAL